MCIRDSHVGEGEIARHIGLGRGVVYHRLAVALARQTHLGPVSYTHLRAHETVLDLVCRLLLENKNYSCYTLSFTPTLPTLNYYPYTP